MAGAALCDGSEVLAFPCTRTAVAEARRRLRGRGPLVGVFDIDGTLLVDGARVACTAALAEYIARTGGVLELVTARPEAARRRTMEQLEAAGLLPLVSRLHMPSARLPNKKEIGAWKARTQAEIEARHGRLDVAVGDNLHDVAPVLGSGDRMGVLVAQPEDGRRDGRTVVAPGKRGRLST